MQRDDNKTSNPLPSAGRWLALMLIGGALQACSLYAAPEPTNDRDFSSVFFSPISTSPVKTPRGPMVALPNAGALKSLDQQAFDNGLRQLITYEDQNSLTRIDVKVGSGSSFRGGHLLSLDKPTQAGILAELSRLSNGGAYQIVKEPMSNKYGPVGVAMIDHCVYAWQWIDDLRKFDLRLQEAGGSDQPASLRIQHCHKSPQEALDLLRDVQQIVLSSGDANRREQVTKTRSREIADARPHRGDEDRLVPQSSTLPPGATIIPRPTNGASLDQRRYLSDPTKGFSLVQTPQSRASAQPLSQDIPPQAYTGPPPNGW